MSDFRILAEIVAPVELPTDVVRDPKDVAVLACALGGNAQYIVTGDDDLLTLKKYRNISIVSPTQFIEVLSTPRT
ncbi:MAG TPA: putative toxin-antitoxin system toxin component, PIN family [Aggregatilineales bacterium]|nr:putative toxin-antitoxin system toxin component, PIN family [Aggregatilineales bacterium]